jgi:hypothetical protein
MADPHVHVMSPGRVDAAMLQRLGRADLVAGEASHAALGADGDGNPLLQLIDVHGAVLHAQPTPVTGFFINPYFNQVPHLYRIYYV